MKDKCPPIRLPLFVVNVEAGSHPKLQWHDHDVSEIVIILSGRGKHLVTVNERTEKADIIAGDVLILHPHIVHSYDDTDNLEMVNVIYDAQELPLPILDGYSMEHFKDFFPLSTPYSPKASLYPIIHLNTDALQQTHRIVEALRQKIVSFAPGVLFETLCLFMQLLVTLNNSNEKPNAAVVKNSHRPSDFQIGKAIYIIGSNYAKPLELEYLAKAVCMSVRNFCRHFKLTTGYSPIQYIIRQRMAHAIEMLTETNNDIETIAQKCGFSSGTYFRRMFVEIQGISPAKYRKEHRNKIEEKEMINIRDFGAVGDGITDDTQAVQRAFDEGSQQQKTVLFPEGTFRTGTLRLRSHLHIRLAKGSTLLGSDNPNDYLVDSNPNRSFGLRMYLLWGENITDFTISGEGTINGNGRAFWEDKFFDGETDTQRDVDVPFGPVTRHLLKPKDPRPCLMYLENSQNITLDGFQIRNSAAYTIWVLGCSHVIIQNLTVKNMHKGPNTDVLDLDCSTDIKVKNCDLDAGDDCIAIKSDTYRLGRNQYSGDMVIENCTLRSVTCGIRIGYEGDGEIKNITFKNLNIIDTRHGINFVSITPGPLPSMIIKKGCDISNILFEDVLIKNSAQAIYAWTGDAGNTGTFDGSIRNVTFRNITAEQHWGSYIGCIDKSCVRDIAFRNVKITQLEPIAPQSPDFIPDNWASRGLGAMLTLRHVTNFTMDASSALIASGDTLLIQDV